MVLLHVKVCFINFWSPNKIFILLNKSNSDENQFLYSTKINSTIKDTLIEIIKIYNLIQRIKILKIECEELSKYGPSKHPSKQSIDTYTDESEIEKGEFYNMDPTGRRTGNGNKN